MSIPSSPRSSANAAAVRRPWESPRVTDLPRLTELTLATPGIPGSGSPGGGGSTVIP